MRIPSNVTRSVSGTVLWLLLAGPAAAQTVVSYPGPPASIPDAFPNGISRSVNAAGLGLVTDIDVRFDALAGCDATAGSPAAAINHTFVGDLIIKLRSPAGTEVILYNRHGGTRENFCQLLLDDDGGFPALSTLSNQTGLSVAGNFAPDAPLAAFDGETANGDWQLTVSDNATLDTGTLNRFSLLIRTAPIAEILVDVPGDPFPGGCAPGSCSLREAVDLANSRPGLDRIHLPAGVLQLTRSGANEDANLNGDLDLSDEVEIVGAGRALTTLAQTQADRVLHALTPGASLALRQLTLAGGQGVADGGAVSVPQSANLAIEDAELSGHRATRRGGAIYHSGSGAPGQALPKILLRRVVFDDNRSTNQVIAPAYGGALYSLSSGSVDPYLVIEDCSFTDNRADDGAGAVALDGVQSVSGNTIRINGSVFARNAVTVAGRGGAIASEVEDNGLVRLRISDSIFQLNSVPTTASTGRGGAISVGFSELVSVQGSLFEQNSARVAGAIDGAGGEIVDSTFCANQAVDSGGALLGIVLAVRRSTLCNNQVTTADGAQFGGGAIAMAAFGELTLERSTLSGNRALRGAGIAMGAGNLSLRSSTIVAPSPLPVGALGSVLRHTGTATADTLSFLNTIMIGQCSYASAGLVPDAAFNNIESSGNTCRLLLAGFQAGNQTLAASSAINLGPLADNGGPTDTHLPAVPSVTIDVAQQIACTLLDQRGYQRSDGSCDIGAVEVGGQPVPDTVFANGFE